VMSAYCRAVRTLLIADLARSALVEVTPAAASTSQGNAVPGVPTGGAVPRVPSQNYPLFPQYTSKRHAGYSCHPGYGGWNVMPDDHPLAVTSVAECEMSCVTTAGCFSYVTDLQPAALQGRTLALGGVGGTCWLRSLVTLSSCNHSVAVDTYTLFPTFDEEGTPLPMAPAAIDGDRTSGLVAVGPPNAWLAIHLGELTSVSYVVVSTTKPFGQASVPLAPFELWLGASADADLTSAATRCTTADDELSKAVQPPRIAGVTEVTMACTGRGSHLTLRLVGANTKSRWLMLTEVAIFADESSTDDPPLLSTTEPVIGPVLSTSTDGLSSSPPPPPAPVAPHRPSPTFNLPPPHYPSSVLKAAHEAAVHDAAAVSAGESASASASTSQVAATQLVQGAADTPMTASEAVGGATAITHAKTETITQKMVVVLCIMSFLCGLATAVGCGFCFILCGQSPPVAPDWSSLGNKTSNGAADDDGMLSVDEAAGSTAGNKGGKRGTGKIKRGKMQLTGRRYAPLHAGMADDTLADLECDIDALNSDARGRSEATAGKAGGAGRTPNRSPGMKGRSVDDQDL